MAIFHIDKTKNYTVMANHHLQNKELSLKAKGLLSVILSLPESWDYTTKGLSTLCKDGVDSINGAIKELEQQGYIVRCRVRNAKGQLTTIEYTIREQPKTQAVCLQAEKNEVKPLTEPKQKKPILAERVAGIVDLLVEVFGSAQPTLTIGKETYPAMFVKNRLRKLNGIHIEYVLDCLDHNANPIRNIKRYLLTALFNTPSTIDNCYATMVSQL